MIDVDRTMLGIAAAAVLCLGALAGCSRETADEATPDEATTPLEASGDSAATRQGADDAEAPSPVDAAPELAPVPASALAPSLGASASAGLAGLGHGRTFWPLPPAPTRQSCAPWPPLERLSTRQREAFAAVYPAGVMAAAVRSDRVGIVAQVVGEGRVAASLEAGPGCGETRSRSRRAEPILPPVSEVLAIPSVDPAPAVAGEEPTPPPPPPRDPVLTFWARDLEPHTEYRYTLSSSELGASGVGRFVTAPVDDVPVRLAFVADLTSDDDDHGLLSAVADADPDIVFNLGDWPYADAMPGAETLGEFHAKHAESRSFPEVQELMRQVGFIGVWDDHEVTNDWDGRDRDRKADKVAAGIAAWHDWFPTTGLAEPDSDGIQRKLSWGPEIDLFILDTRAFRDKNSRTDGPRKSLLGKDQERWLLAGLGESKATWKVILSSVPLVQATTKADAWDGYRNQRDRIMDAVNAAGIRGVLVISADQHWFAAHDTRWGIKELQVGPVGAFLRTPRAGAPAWVRHQYKALNFGLLDYTPGSPSRLTFRAVAADGVFYEADIPLGFGEVAIESASPWVGWHLHGAHTFTGRGSVTLPRVPPGDYVLEWDPVIPGTAVEGPARFTLDDGGRITVSTQAEPPVAPLFVDTFDALAPPGEPTIAWTALDQGSKGGRSRWDQTGDAMGQFAPVRDVDEPAETRALDRIEPRLGTVLIGSETFGEGRFQVDAFAGDDDGWGIVWGIDTEVGRGYRLAFDGARGGWRIVALGGDEGPELIAEDLTFATPLGRWTRIELERRGDEHTLWLDGRELARFTDARYPSGRIGLYAWSMRDIRFDRVVAMPL